MVYRFLRFPEFKTKALCFSYDDGWIFDRNVVEILGKYGFKGTFNIPSSAIRRTDEFALTENEFKELYLPNGHEIALHGEQHVALIKSATIDGIKDVLDNRATLEKFYGRIIRGYAYADNGSTNDEIKEYLKMLGLVYARSVGMENGSFAIPDDWYCWMPTVRHTDSKFMDYAEQFLEDNPISKSCACRDSLLFMVMGHSWELDGKWEVLEKFCSKMSGHSEIWTATCMEIYEYVTAYRSLVFSVDNKIVYNPTNITVYYEEDEKNYIVKPNEMCYVK